MLRELVLFSNQIGDDGAWALAEALFVRILDLLWAVRVHRKHFHLQFSSCILFSPTDQPDIMLAGPHLEPNWRCWIQGTGSHPVGKATFIIIHYYF